MVELRLVDQSGRRVGAHLSRSGRHMCTLYHFTRFPNLVSGNLTICIEFTDTKVVIDTGQDAASTQSSQARKEGAHLLQI